MKHDPVEFAIIQGILEAYIKAKTEFDFIKVYLVIGDGVKSGFISQEDGQLLIELGTFRRISLLPYPFPST